VINLGPAGSDFLRNVASSAREFQLNIEEMDAQTVMTRWPEIRIPDDYRAIFEPASGILRSELAVESWIRLAREAAPHSSSTARYRPFTTPNGVTVETLDGEYSGKKLLVSAGTWVTRLMPELLSSRYVKFSPGFRRMAATAAKITSRRLPVS
jgi:N-methyl-L-tryptophan oxidase